jgi:hypothetical protein
MAKKSSKKVAQQTAATAAVKHPGNASLNGQSAAPASALPPPAAVTQPRPTPAVVPPPVAALAPSAKAPAPTLVQRPPEKPAPIFAPPAAAVAAVPPTLPPAQPFVANPPDSEPAGVDALKRPLAPKVKVTFALLEPKAERVSVSGDFNGWSPETSPMQRHAGGHWETTLDLEPGRYQYKFIVDGQWIPDPLAHENLWNPHGTLNSVLEVGA